MSNDENRSGPLGFTPYQWLVLFAAWLGWGFDVFDGHLFNYVSPICIPDLLGLDPALASTKDEVAFWTGALTALLLVGWGLGGILFGKVTDVLGRTRTLLLTMLTYALATAACAFAPNVYALAFFRFIASLGIGGEWAAGASLVAEVMPEKKRALGGALLYTSAPAGLFLATYVNDLFTRQLDFIASDPSRSWRAVFLTGLVPAAVALVIRMKVKEPEHWKPSEAEPKVRELFSPELRRRTLGGLAMAMVALLSWWCCATFLPMIARYLADDVVPAPPPEDLPALRTRFVTIAMTSFNLGGLVGTLLTVPVATRMGRRPMFLIYFLLGAASIWITLGLPLQPETRLYLAGLIGLTIFGVFGSFTYYLPELFPMRLRGTGAGFCYNTGRFITAAMAFLIGVKAKTGIPAIEIVRWAALIPLAGVLILLAGYVEETKDQELR